MRKMMGFSRRVLLKRLLFVGALIPMPGVSLADTSFAPRTSKDGKWICTNPDCEGHIYDPAVGDPDSGIPPGVAFEDLPEDWFCPVCGQGKSAFIPY